ncbi:cell division protein FtsL [Allofournierella sp.]|uniref:cell division protein FtsL n=1 Tax=Allofournierella sp. TaxID=1940256 RepID=UPI003AB88F57
MAQAAYDLERFEHREREPKARVRAVQGAKKPSRFNAHTAKLAAVTAILVTLVCGLLYSQATLTELTGDIQATQRELVEAQSEYNYLSSVLDSKTGLKNVEEIATTQLGLMKLDRSQITYFSLDGESSIRRPDSTAKRITEFLTTSVLSLAEYLDP